MATPNYGFVTPDDLTLVDIDDLNGNFEEIDTLIKNVSDSSTANTAAVAALDTRVDSLEAAIDPTSLVELDMINNWAPSTGGFYLRKFGNIIFMQGRLLRSSGSTSAVNTAVAAGLRPATNFEFTSRLAVTTTPILCQMNSAGVLSIGSGYTNGDDLFVSAFYFAGS